MSIKKGDKIKVEYTGTLEDGTVFDSSEKQGKPLEFEVGSGQVIKGFDDAVIGMEKGETKQITLSSDQAYGEHRPELIKKVPRDQLPKGQEPKAGMFLMMRLPDGVQLPAKITEVSDKDVTIDLNHPLAGKSLNFKIRVVDIA
ncbi:peptidylprolyl isomerase [Candidatus Woesearchaeota archaeon]|nr:MAG: peptidylprolyl isomerase [Candidatus Woesearchaeota archaeon]